MKKERARRSKIIAFAVTEKEYERLQQLLKKSTNPYISNYCRTVLLQEPVYASYVDQSLTAVTAELFRLRQELHQANDLYDLALKARPAEAQNEAFNTWRMAHDRARNTLLEDIKGIKAYINKTAETWLQS